MKCLGREWLRAENTVEPFVRSAGAKLFSRCAEEVIEAIGALENPDISWCQYLIEANNQRSGLREVMFLSFYSCSKKIVETIIFVALGILFALGGDLQCLEHAFRTSVHVVSNLFFSCVGFAGQFSPVRTVLATLKYFREITADLEPSSDVNNYFETGVGSVLIDASEPNLDCWSKFLKRLVKAKITIFGSEAELAKINQDKMHRFEKIQSIVQNIKAKKGEKPSREVFVDVLISS